jgi:tRNA A-37 threonylcarbamoyl transferase component Bud32
MKTRTITNDWLRRAELFPRLIKGNGFSLLMALLRKKLENVFVYKEIRFWQGKKEEILRNRCNEYKTTIDDVGLELEQRKVLKETQRQLREVVIADVDQDGYFLSHFGPIIDLPMVSREQFVERIKYRIRLVMLDGSFCFKKYFRGNRGSFMNELRALHTLRPAGCNVPSIMDVDFDNRILYVSFIPGHILREELANKGAILRDRDVSSHSMYAKLTESEKWLRRIYEGKQKLYQVVDAQFIEDLYAEIQKIHLARFIWNDIKYGNVIIEKKTRKPFLVDFENARYFPHLSQNAFLILRDREIERFNLHFGPD